ncbi:NnrS family protein [Tahibacter amnicola]|uniref:NnrS family protein n=1 Tax=Tahibacter amnicola TaxID=2976241 RepID=UPI0031BAC1DE
MVRSGPLPYPAGWMHAFVMQYQVLPPFIFGFLLTVFPRWMGLPELSRWHYVPVGLGLLGGQLLCLAGLAGSPSLVQAGAMLSLMGWLAAWAFLVRLIWQEGAKTWHAISCAAALLMGAVGLVLFNVYLHGGDARLLFASIKFGSFGLLLPIYVTVAHRMFPFFAGNVVIGYRVWRPLTWLGVFWVLAIAHLGLELAHGYAWLWLADVPLLGIGVLWAWKTWPRGPAPALLRVLFLGYAWLPVAFALFVIQSLWYAIGGDFILGRAPAHALFIGFFGSLLVAMVTRVTQGHSGRPLELGTVAGIAFVAVQGVAVIRIAAELLPDGPLWQAAAGIGWIAAFLPWVFRSAWIYLTPRADGRAG